MNNKMNENTTNKDITNKNTADKNTTKNNNKTFQILVYVFAIIGVIALGACIIFLGMNALNKAPKDTSDIAKIIEDYADADNTNAEGIDERFATGDLQDSDDTPGDYHSDSETIGDDISVDTSVTDSKDSKADKTKLHNEKPLIVFLGDSIMDYHRDDKTGIPYLTALRCDADYINLSVAGICASLAPTDETNINKWNSTSGVGLTRAMAGIIDPKVLVDCTAKELIIANKSVFAKTDVFVVEYGINDFLAERLTNDSDIPDSLSTYQGALQDIIKNLRSIAPDAYIVLMSPGYCEFYAKDGSSIGNSYSLINGMGYTLMDYLGKIECVDDWDNGIMLYDTNIENGINNYSAQQYLEDGIHLTEAGRAKYADMLGGMMNRNIFMTEEPLDI